MSHLALRATPIFQVAILFLRYPQGLLVADPRNGAARRFHRAPIPADPRINLASDDTFTRKAVDIVDSLQELLGRTRLFHHRRAPLWIKLSGTAEHLREKLDWAPCFTTYLPGEKTVCIDKMLKLKRRKGIDHYLETDLVVRQSTAPPRSRGLGSADRLLARR